MNKKSFCYAILFMLVVSIAISGCGKKDKYVNIVREGNMYMAPNVKIGKAFDKFFKNSDWKSFVSTDKQRIVEFHGEFKWKDKPAKLVLQFTVHPNNTFEMGAMTVNNVDMNALESASILHKVLTGN